MSSFLSQEKSQQLEIENLKRQMEKQKQQMEKEMNEMREKMEKMKSPDQRIRSPVAERPETQKKTVQSTFYKVKLFFV